MPPLLHMLEEDDVTLFNAPVAALAAYFDPLDGDEWGCDPIDPELVLEAALDGRVQKEHWAAVNRRNRGVAFDDHGWHVERIAWFYLNPEDGPLELDVMRFEWATRLRIMDGNHRFASAVLRGDDMCAVAVEDHNVEAFLKLVPEAEPIRFVPVPAPSMTR